ncbi:MAG: PQQ-binding-like beta-propeller repeat protein [Opitutae bacterium]|nr:PQQ-binding-like beta-propeller repeat protein [Opitutae bacterium]MBT6957872.1 PQQ-binding-like beta-propeller repeat protein [Opitutae bacterium]MBT7852837.1 PQQ-binding-like beta-propeller repeat protein [Opitutae bacterium]
MNRFKFLVYIIYIFPITNNSLTSATWNQWRGPNRDGIIPTSQPWPKSISKDTLKLQWERPLDKGYSSPIVSDEMVFTVETVEAKNEVVRAFDRQSGKQIWKTTWVGALKVPFFARKNGSWVRSTPAYDGTHLYVGGIRDVLVCMDAKTGEITWELDFVKKFGSKLPSFGFVCSPLIDGKDLYIQAGGGLAKLDKQSGKVLWRGLNDGGGMWGSAFSSPVIRELNGVRQLIVQSREKLMGVNMMTGETLWEKKVKAFRGMNILTPTTYGNSIFTSVYGGRSTLFDIRKSGKGFEAKALWDNGQQGYMSSPVLIGDHAYHHLRKKRFVCMDLKDGEIEWTSERTFGEYWSMISNGERILALDEKGILFHINPSPKKFKLLEERKLTDHESWAHLGMDGKQVFIRHLNGIQCYTWE